MIPLPQTKQIETDDHESTGQNSCDDHFDQLVDRCGSGAGLDARKQPAKKNEEHEDDGRVRDPMMAGQLFHRGLNGGAFFLHHDQ